MPPHPSSRAPQPEQHSLVTTHSDDGSVLLEVGSRLDAETGAELLAATSTALLGEPDRISVDLCRLSTWTEEGANALVGCRGCAPTCRKGSTIALGAGQVATRCSPPTPEPSAATRL